MASEQGMGLLLSRSLCDLFNTSVNCTNVLICTRTQNMDSGFHAASNLSAKGFKGFKCWLIWGTCKLSDPNLLQTVEHGTEGTHGQSAKYSYVFLMLGPICSHNLQSLDFVWMDMMNQSLKAWHSVWQMDFAGKHWRAAGSSTWTCAEAQRGASSIQLELVFERLTSLNPNAPYWLVSNILGRSFPLKFERSWKVLQQQKIRDGTSFVIKLGDKNVAGHNWRNRRFCFFTSLALLGFAIREQPTLSGGLWR